VHIKRNRCLFR